ncbi:MAG: hypothetical protein SGPRY_010210, partial [Prymnesium sp.]
RDESKGVQMEARNMEKDKLGELAAHALSTLLSPSLLAHLSPPSILSLLLTCKRLTLGSSSEFWRKVYSSHFPLELDPHLPPSLPASPSIHPSEWRRLYLERRLHGEEAVPCLLLSPDAMARATFCPAAIRVIEAYTCRLCQMVARAFSSSLSPPDDPASRALLLAQCEHAISSSDTPSARAAMMILRQAERCSRLSGGWEDGGGWEGGGESASAGGSEAGWGRDNDVAKVGGRWMEGSSCWCLEKERAQLVRRYRELTPIKVLCAEFLSSADKAIAEAREATGQREPLGRRRASKQVTNHRDATKQEITVGKGKPNATVAHSPQLSHTAGVAIVSNLEDAMQGCPCLSLKDVVDASAETAPGIPSATPRLLGAARVGMSVKARREGEEAEWETATIRAVDMVAGRLTLLFSDRHLASAVPLSRVQWG